MAGGAESAARNTVDVTGSGQLGRERVETMRRVSEARQKDERPSRAAPIEHFEIDVRVHVNELHPMVDGSKLVRGLLGSASPFHWERPVVPRGGALDESGVPTEF